MLKRIMPAVVAVFLLVLCSQAQTKLLRFPDIFGDRVVFTYGGDLWTRLPTGAWQRG
jgi:tricorn protease